MALQSLIPLRIKKITQETRDTRSFVLEEMGNAIQYQAGQFLTFVFPTSTGEDRRSYSLSSASVLHEPLQITVKRIANGAWSRWLVDRAVEGDVLHTIGCTGYFVLPDDLNGIDHFVFFAAGSGITPIFSLIKTILHTVPRLKLVLVYSNRSPETTIFRKELLELQKQFAARLSIDFLYSAANPRRRLNVGMIEMLADRYLHNSLFFVCGPLEYMRTISIVLKTSGIKESAIRREIFYIEKPPVKELPPDALPHQVTLQLDDHEFRFEVQYPATILQTAKSLNIPIPYSCEAGQCGTCSATCTAGKVWMWHNDVLLDDELSAGRVLTCTGYPVGGDVKLRIASS